MPDPGMVLVLWSDHFDEVAAAALVTAFRRAGIRARLVGLQQGGVRGSSGLTLIPDMTLEQALQLVERVLLVAIPASAGAVELLDNDPRVRELLAQTYARQATVVTSIEAAPTVAALLGNPAGELPIHTYAADLDFTDAVESLIAAIRRRPEARPLLSADTPPW